MRMQLCAGECVCVAIDDRTLWMVFKMMLTIALAEHFWYARDDDAEAKQAGRIAGPFGR